MCTLGNVTTVKLINTSITSHNVCVVRTLMIYSPQISRGSRGLRTGVIRLHTGSLQPLHVITESWSLGTDLSPFCPAPALDDHMLLSGSVTSAF